VKVIAGQVDGVSGPISQPATDPTYLDIALEPGAEFTQSLPPDYAAFLYVFEGTLQVGASPETSVLRTHELGVLGEGEEIRLKGLTAGAGGTVARAILVAGRPLREPVAKYGPFVMNTREELQQAFEDFQRGKF
jgi:redox-sensitive bicupin YhaK (pirin superfamily)